MRLSRYFLPVLRETPAEAQIVSHRLMLRAGMIRQEAAGIYAWLPLGHRVLKKDRADRPRGDGPGRRRRTADADPAAGRPVARERPLRRLRRGDAAHQGPPRPRAALRADQRGDDHRDLPRLCPLATRTCRSNLYHIQWKFRDEPAPALRRHARSRIPDEGRLFIRRRRGRGRRVLQPDVRRLPAHLRAAWA